MRVWNSYWFRPATPIDLAIVRIVIVGYQLFLMLSSDKLQRMVALSTLPGKLYDPLPILHLLIWPLGWNYRPPVEILTFIFWLTFIVGIFSFVGWKAKATLFFFALGNLFIQAFLYSHKDIHHPQGIVMITLFLLALGPVDQKLSIDAFLSKRSNGFRAANRDCGTDSFARWPLLVVQWIFALAYFSAARWKLAVGGLEWMNGFTLQYYLANDGLRRGLELGVWLSQHHTLALLLSWFAIVFEGTFFVVLIFPSLVWLYIPSGIALHTGMFLTMGANFFQWVTLYSVFIPWTRIADTVKVWSRGFFGDYGKEIISDPGSLATGGRSE